MQINQHIGQVEKGTRRPDMDRTFNEVRATLETWSGRRGADESRGTASQRAEGIARSTRVPCRYGAGF